MRNNIRGKKSGIYCITNLINNKKYIGSAVDLKRRLQQHIDGKYSNAHLQCSISKYGKNNFSIRILEYVDDKNIILKREQFWIDQFKTKELYNVALNVEQPMLGRKHTKEAIQKNRIANKANKTNTTAKRRITSKKAAQKWSKAVRQINISTGKTIKTFKSITEAAELLSINKTAIEQCCARQRYSSAGGFIWRYTHDVKETPKELILSTITHLKPIAQLDKQTEELLAIYPSINQAEKVTGVANQDIGRCARGKHKSAGGFKWKYIDHSMYLDAVM